MGNPLSETILPIFVHFHTNDPLYAGKRGMGDLKFQS